MPEDSLDGFVKACCGDPAKHRHSQVCDHVRVETLARFFQLVGRQVPRPAAKAQAKNSDA
jgi:hypothetical protein